MTEAPTVVCLTPVKNEARLLEAFLSAASEWADRIIVADQYSDDGSPEIAARFSKVTSVVNRDRDYDEASRQKLLLTAARALPGKHILVALDADELLSANWSSSAEWPKLMQAKPGTIGFFRWANVRPGGKTCWLSEFKPFAFVDDGSDHVGSPIHSYRLPMPDHGPRLYFEDVRVLHLQYVDWERMKSKQRWYQCWEALHSPNKSAVSIYRQYHRMHVVDERQIRPLERSWVGPTEMNALVAAAGSISRTGWDEEVAELLATHGPGRFRKLAIWDVDWDTIQSQSGGAGLSLRDPRNLYEKVVHRWLERSQPHATSLRTRVVQRMIRMGGW